jgi:hypothetical protein
MPKPGRVTAPGFFVRRERARPRQEEQPMPFHKAQSGNPAGRPRGSRNRPRARVQSLLEGKAEDVARKVIEMAQAGNIRALRMCLDRIAPAPKYEPGTCELPPLENPADTVKAMAKIAEAVATGDLAPCEAISMAKVVETYIHALQAKAFDERLAKVETQAANNAKLPDYGEGV